jgi:hypothetical protein
VHVSGGTSTHHQELGLCIQLLVFVKPCCYLLRSWLGWNWFECPGHSNQEIIYKYPAIMRCLGPQSPSWCFREKKKTVPHAGSRTTITSVAQTVAYSLYWLRYTCDSKGKGTVHPRRGHEVPEGEEKCSCTLYLTSALNWCGWSMLRLGQFTPGNLRYPMDRRLGGSQRRSGHVRKISPPTGIRSPDRPARSESLSRLRCSFSAMILNWNFERLGFLRGHRLKRFENHRNCWLAGSYLRTVMRCVCKLCLLLE